MCLWKHITGYSQISGHWLHHLLEVSSYLEWRFYISLKNEKKQQRWIIQWTVIQICFHKKLWFLTMFSWIIDSLVRLDENVAPSGWHNGMDHFFIFKHIAALSNKKDIWLILLFESLKLMWINLKRQKSYLNM